MYFSKCSSTKQRLKLGIVKIEDTIMPVARAMLEFIYTGKATDLDRYASEILILAEKYGIFKSKYQCEMALSKSLDLENVYQMIMASVLRNAAIDFIGKNQAHMFQTNEWNSFKENHSKLVFEVWSWVLEEALPVVQSKILSEGDHMKIDTMGSFPSESINIHAMQFTCYLDDFSYFIHQ